VGKAARPHPADGPEAVEPLTGALTRPHGHASRPAAA
jgi:hypothetical protein